jgi:hypothetical protein
MDKKDYKTLMEAYDEIASLTISPEDHDGSESDFSREDDLTDGLEVRPADSADHGNEDLEEMEDKKIQMVETHLRSIVAHAHQAISAIKKGSVIEPWMQDLIAISADNIVNTANSLVYRHEVD